jgi:hypothetical protein
MAHERTIGTPITIETINTRRDRTAASMAQFLDRVFQVFDRLNFVGF